MPDITPIKQTKISAWQDSLNAVTKQLKIAQSLQAESLNLMKEAQELEITERAKVLGNVTMSLSKAQDMENQCYDRITYLRSHYPY